MTSPTVVVHVDERTVAQAVAARFVTRVVDAQAARGSASVVITGGTIVNSALAAVAGSGLRDTVDWSRLDVWWGDERFLPSGDPERNETQARAALLDSVPLDPRRVHPMPALGGAAGDRPEHAAEAYAAMLSAAARPEDHGPVPTFDLVVLGMGPDGHVASLFPEHPALYDEGTVTGVRGAPKPPPERVTLTLRSINSARQVWIVATGEEKAKAVRMALAGAGPVQIPAAGVHGRSQTLFLLDRAAAARLAAWTRPVGLAMSPREAGSCDVDRRLGFLLAGVQKGGHDQPLRDARAAPADRQVRAARSCTSSTGTAATGPTRTTSRTTARSPGTTRRRSPGRRRRSTCSGRSAMERIKAYNPDMRIVLSFRDPIQRAFSQWCMERERRKDVPDFAEAIRAASPTRWPRTATEAGKAHRAFVARGYYGEQLAHVLELFPRRPGPGPRLPPALPRRARLAGPDHRLPRHRPVRPATGGAHQRAQPRLPDAVPPSARRHPVPR